MKKWKTQEIVNETWNWKWEVMERPDSSDDIEIGGITTKKLHLSKLIAGGYTLSLEVNNDKETKRGNGTFHFNVLEAKKVNHPPRAIISDLPAPILPDTKVKLPRNFITVEIRIYLLQFYLHFDVKSKMVL